MRTDDMSSIQSLLGPMMKLPGIKKPPKFGGTFEDWERFLRECDEAGISAVTDKGQFVTELGRALYRRWRWLAYARENNLSFPAAQAAWDRYSGQLPRKREWSPPRPQDAPQTPSTLPGVEREGPAFYEAAVAVVDEPMDQPESEEVLIAHARELGLLD